MTPQIAIVDVSQVVVETLKYNTRPTGTSAATTINVRTLSVTRFIDVDISLNSFRCLYSRMIAVVRKYAREFLKPFKSFKGF